jgi:hypothetical protein
MMTVRVVCRGGEVSGPSPRHPVASVDLQTGTKSAREQPIQRVYRRFRRDAYPHAYYWAGQYNTVCFGSL